MAVKKYYDSWFATDFTYEDVELNTHGKRLFFQRVSSPVSEPTKNIILVHGLTANSKILDIQYKGYSIVRNYAANGYSGWLIDLSGHGLSEEWEDPLSITTKTAAEDIIAAAEKIIEFYGVKNVDVLGWSWGTATGAMAERMRPELFRKLILLSPLTASCHPRLPKGTFTKTPYGETPYGGTARLFPIKGVPGGIVPPEDFEFDEARVELGMVNKAMHDFFRYVAPKGKPNGPAEETMTGEPIDFVQPENITCPAFIAYGDNDGYNTVEEVNEMIEKLPEGSGSLRCPGGTHAIPFDKKALILHTAILSWLNQ
jgi:pimeloyl-ACP methyl ester carboxylesterase